MPHTDARARRVHLHVFIALTAVLTGCGGGLFGRSAGPDEVDLATLQPRSLELILPEAAVCPGSAYGLVVAMNLGEREILAMPRGLRADLYPENERRRIEAALEEGEFVELSQMDVTVEGPATFRQSSMWVTSDPSRALDGPIHIRARSPHHPSVEAATASLPIRFNCTYELDGRGADGRQGQSGEAGQAGWGTEHNQDRHGTAGGAGGAGTDGHPGANVELIAVAFRGPDGRDWAQVLARNLTEGTERKYLLPPDATLRVSVEGGRGGSGGTGGEGGAGRDQVGGAVLAGNGGDGGAGGQGGRGGPGGRLHIVVDPALAGRLSSLIVHDASGGRGGSPGRGGRRGDSGMYNMDGSPQAVVGEDGPEGGAGQAGPDGEVRIEQRRMDPPFAVDTARLAAALEGRATSAGASASSSTAPSSHNTADPNASSRGPSERSTGASSTSNAARPPPQPAAPAGHELATGRFTTVPLSLSRGGRTIISLAANGEVTSGRAVIGRIEGGTFINSRGEVAFALSRDGTLHARIRDVFQPVARLLPNGRVTWEDADIEVRVAADGRLSRRARGRTDSLESRFARVPRNALRTAAFLAYMAAGALR